MCLPPVEIPILLDLLILFLSAPGLLAKLRIAVTVEPVKRSSSTYLEPVNVRADGGKSCKHQDWLGKVNGDAKSFSRMMRLIYLEKVASGARKGSMRIRDLIVLASTIMAGWATPALSQNSCLSWNEQATSFHQRLSVINTCSYGIVFVYSGGSGDCQRGARGLELPCWNELAGGAGDTLNLPPNVRSTVGYYACLYDDFLSGSCALEGLEPYRGGPKRVSSSPIFHSREVR